MNFNDMPEAPFDLERLLPEAVAQALSDENPDNLLAWLRANLPRFADPVIKGEARFTQMTQALTGHLLLMIWNPLPLPGNGFAPRPLPLPGRNDPCLCGSGRKHKHCCASAPKFPPLDPLVLWPIVLENLPPSRLGQALAKRQIPTDALIAFGLQKAEEEKHEEVIELLEPVLRGPLKKPKLELAVALQLLCDAYDELGYDLDMRGLLERIVSEAPASPLRSGAWQRLAAMRIDEEDLKEAREAFERAMRDDPDDPALSFLEVQLLGSEERWDTASERARFWAKRLKKPLYDPEQVQPIIEFLEEAIIDPRAAIEKLSEVFEELGVWEERVLDWIDAAVKRPLPPYRAVEEETIDLDEGEEGLAFRLRGMGISADEIPKALAMIEERKAGIKGGDSEPEEEDLPEDDESLVLQAPESIPPLESSWKEAIGIDKPFGTADAPMGEWDGWLPEKAEIWCAFLERNPAAADSLDILDDLATALLQYPEGASSALLFKGVVPLLQRAAAIVEQALAGVESPRLRWNRPGNRPALRSLVRLYYFTRFSLKDEAQSDRLFNLLITLNPEDNHGVRTEAVNQYLRSGQDEEALELAEKFPDDLFAETRYGRVLALYRLGRAKSAQEAAEEALDELPLVARYLVRSRIRRPELSPYGIRPGGEDQAWLYRQEMREVWEASPGALDWLKKIMKLKGVK